MINLQKKTESKMVIEVDYASESGKLGRHNLSFRTGAHKDKKKEARRKACRGRIKEY